MEQEYILSLVTLLVSFILGIISKKSKFISNKLIPIQNLAIGVIVALINFVITKDFNSSIAISGLLAGGIYDVCHNLEKIIKDE